MSLLCAPAAGSLRGSPAPKYKLQLRVFATTDPVFTVVAFNEAVFEELMTAYQLVLTKNNDELAEKVVNLVVLHGNLVAASQNLVERANQAHLTAALRSDRGKGRHHDGATHGLSTELDNASSIVTNVAHQLVAASKKTHAKTTSNWYLELRKQSLAVQSVARWVHNTSCCSFPPRHVPHGDPYDTARLAMRRSGVRRAVGKARGLST